MTKHPFEIIAAAGVLSALAGGTEAMAMTASMATTSPMANQSEDGCRLAAAIFLRPMTPTGAVCAVSAGAASGAQVGPNLRVLHERSGLYDVNGPLPLAVGVGRPNMAAAAKDPSSVPRFAAARAYDGAAAPDPSALDASRRDGPTLFSLRFR